MVDSLDLDALFDLGVTSVAPLKSCPRCSHEGGLKQASARRQVLRCSKCRYETTSRRESVFAGTRLPGALWVRAAMLLHDQPEITSVALANTLQVTQKTAWRMLKILKTGQGVQFTVTIIGELNKGNGNSSLTMKQKVLMKDSRLRPTSNSIAPNEVNTLFHGDCVEGISRRVPDGAVDLIIADPPYFKVIGEKWDYQWRTEEEYLEWSEEWLKEAYRALRLGGSFYLFGYFRTLAKLVPLMESIGFKLRQQIVVNKGITAISGRATKNYKQFPNVTESILFLVKDPIPFSRAFLKSRQKELKLTAKSINEALGVKSNGGGMWSIYTGKNICEQLPTAEHWENLSKVLDFDLPYERISITFNAEMGITDVWTDIDFYKKGTKRIHPTQKPLALIERLVLASSNAGDLILDPFMGSGTTAVAAAGLGRNWIGFETDEKYYAAAKDRIQSTTVHTIGSTINPTLGTGVEQSLF